MFEKTIYDCYALYGFVEFVLGWLIYSNFTWIYAYKLVSRLLILFMRLVLDDHKSGEHAMNMKIKLWIANVALCLLIYVSFLNQNHQLQHSDNDLGLFNESIYLHQASNLIFLILLIFHSQKFYIFRPLLDISGSVN